jgi:hypothetical protein
MNIRITVPGNVYRYAKMRAGGTDHLLRRRIEEFVTNYANGNTAQQRGGKATAANLTADELSEKMRGVVTARWARRDAEKTQGDEIGALQDDLTAISRAHDTLADGTHQD